MKRKGFSLIELLVAMVIFAIILGIVATILIQTTRAKRLTEIIGEAQEHARIATDVITYYLRQAGYNTEVSPISPFAVPPQMNICWAGPYEVVINADIDPIHSAMDPIDEPKIVPTSPVGPAHYQPTFFYTRGAETIRLSIDSDNDGDVTGADRNDENAEKITRNPNDAVLMLQIYGKTAANNNDGTNIPVALIRSPDAWPGQNDDVTPIFQYWLDPDGPGGNPIYLFGDIDGDGSLSIAEIQVLTFVPPDLCDKIIRVNITCIGETRNPYRGSYLQRISRTGVVVTRNLPEDMNIISGRVFNDMNKDTTYQTGEGISGITINLSTGDSYVTQIEGFYQFTVEPALYEVTQVLRAGLDFFDPENGILLVDVSDTSVTAANFADTLVPTGYVKGYVYSDTLDSIGYREPGEPGIPHIPVLFKDGFVAITNDSGYYEQEINAECITFVKTGLPDTLMSSGYWICIPTPPETLIQFGDSAYFYLSEDETVHVDCGTQSGVGYITGFVFQDNDRDSTYDLTEPKLSGVKITVLRDSNFVNSGVTNDTGHFFLAVSIGSLTVIETDPPGYSSTNSNYVKAYVDSAGDTVEVRPFADITVTQIVLVGNALSLSAPDIDFDGNMDMCLTTDLGDTNINVWRNKYINPNNPNPLRPNLFDSLPDYKRIAECLFTNTPISILGSVTKDFDGNNYEDLACGLKDTTNNIRFWFATHITEWVLEIAPSKVYTAVTGFPVFAIAADDFDGDGDYDIAIGTADTTDNKGYLEVWLNDGIGNFSVSFVDSIEGQINAIATGNIFEDTLSLPDLVLATKTGENTGQLVLYENFGSDSFAYDTVLITAGEANDVSICDLGEDSLSSDLDIIDGTKDSTWSGYIEIWHNQGGGTFGINNILPDNYREIPDGAIECLITGPFSFDIYPDIVIGLKTSLSYDGRIEFYDVYDGFLPLSPTDPSGGLIKGEVRAMTKADFDKDGYLDFIVGERTGNIVGHLYIIYMR